MPILITFTTWKVGLLERNIIVQPEDFYITEIWILQISTSSLTYRSGAHITLTQNRTCARHGI